MREKIIKREPKQVNPNKLTCLYLQDLADFLDGETVEDIDKQRHLTGMSLEAVYINRTSKFVYDIFKYRGKYYSRLDWDLETVLDYKGEPMKDHLGSIKTKSGLVGWPENEIIGWLDPTEVIRKVDLWRNAAAEQKLIPDPNEIRPMPDDLKKKVLRWVNKEGVEDIEKYDIQPYSVDENMPMPLRLKTFF